MILTLPLTSLSKIKLIPVSFCMCLVSSMISVSGKSKLSTTSGPKAVSGFRLTYLAFDLASLVIVPPETRLPKVVTLASSSSPESSSSNGATSISSLSALLAASTIAASLGSIMSSSSWPCRSIGFCGEFSSGGALLAALS